MFKVDRGAVDVQASIKRCRRAPKVKVVASNGMKLECCVKVKKTIQIHKNKVKVEVKSEI